MTDKPTSAEVLRGIQGVEAVDEETSNSILPFDPREKGPRDVLGDALAWARSHRIIVLAALAGVFIYQAMIGFPSIEIPEWGYTAIATAPFAVIPALWAGLKVGKILSPSKGKLVSQLDAVDGGQELLRISEDRWRDLVVLDYDGNERPRDYLRSVAINGETAVECDAYYPRQNVAVCSWQAGATNKEIRQHEHAVDQIKTEQDRAAQEGLKAAMEKPQEVAHDVARHSNVLIGMVEGVLTPEEVDLVKLRYDYDADRMDGSADDHLANLEGGHPRLGGSSGDDDRDDQEEPTRREELEERGRELLAGLGETLSRDRNGSEGSR